LYQDTIKDVIYETDAAPKNFVNLFDASHHGLELTSKHRWGDASWLMINYTFQTMSSNVQLPYAGSYSDTMPKQMVSALYATKIANNIDFSLGYYQQGTMAVIDQGVKDRQAFTRRVDIRVAKQFKIDNAGHHAEVALVVQGLSGAGYNDYLIQNQFNRRAFITTSVAF
jgi:hypothetical protein